MKTLTTLMFSFLLIGTTFSQKFVYRTMNDLTVKPKGNVVLDSAIYDKGTLFQVRKFFNKEGKLVKETNQRGYPGTEKRTRYDYISETEYTQLVDSVLIGGGSWYGKSKRTYRKIVILDPNYTEWLSKYYVISGYTSDLNPKSSRSSLYNKENKLVKVRLDSTAADGTKIRWVYEYTYGKNGTVQESRFIADFPTSDKYRHTNPDTLEIKSYAVNHFDNTVKTDYFMTNSDTIVGYPFIFCLQPQPVPVFSQEQVVTTKDQYGNILTASYNGHTATFYYSKSTNTSIFEIKADNGLKVYPTIITSTLNITDYNGLKTVSVFNLSGSLVHKEEVESNSIDLSFLSKGMYIVSIETETGISNHKIVKQ